MFRNRILVALVALQICGATCAFAAQTSGVGNLGDLRAGIGRHIVTFRWGPGPKPAAPRLAFLRWRVLGYLLSVHEEGLSGSNQGAPRTYFSESEIFESAKFGAGRTYSAALAEVGLYLNSDRVEVTQVKTFSMGPPLAFTIPADFQDQSGLEAQAPPLVSLEALHAYPDSYVGRVIAVEGLVGLARTGRRGERHAQPVAGSYSSVDKGLVQGGFELPVSGGRWSAFGGAHPVELIGYFGLKPGGAKTASENSRTVDDYCFQELAVLSSSKP